MQYIIPVYQNINGGFGGNNKQGVGPWNRNEGGPGNNKQGGNFGQPNKPFGQKSGGPGPARNQQRNSMRGGPPQDGMKPAQREV